jgi:hypothetical protein
MYHSGGHGGVECRSRCCRPWGRCCLTWSLRHWHKLKVQTYPGLTISIVSSGTHPFSCVLMHWRYRDSVSGDFPKRASDLHLQHKDWASLKMCSKLVSDFHQLHMDLVCGSWHSKQVFDPHQWHMDLVSALMQVSYHLKCMDWEFANVYLNHCKRFQRNCRSSLLQGALIFH